MDNKEMNKLNPEELDQVAGGSIIDDVSDTFKKGVDIVKTATGAAMEAGEAVLNKAKDKVDDLFGAKKSPLHKDQDDS